VRECDLLIVATGWPDYKEIDPAWCKRNGSRLTILDLWRTLPAGKFDDVADLLYLGSGR
jgi:UDPglucose 6-dehydrogenase